LPLVATWRTSLELRPKVRYLGHEADLTQKAWRLRRRFGAMLHRCYRAIAGHEPSSSGLNALSPGMVATSFKRSHSPLDSAGDLICTT
jgi:hypothetical protein